MKSARGRWGTAVIGACVALGTSALALPGTAWGASHRPRHERVVHTQVFGRLTIAWRGDPARGCAAAGLCGVSGTLQMNFGGDESVGPPPPQLNATDPSAVARVQTTEPDGSVITCADLVPVTLDLTVHRSGGRVTARTAAADPVPGPNSGRCAGPTSGDLAALPLPARRAPHGYDLSGRTTSTAGPFAVTVISGVHAVIGPGGGGGLGGLLFGPGPGGSGGPVKTHPALVEHARVTYRVIGFSGAMTADFAGLAAPQCEPVGACGVSGRLVQSFATRGSVTFLGARIVTRHFGRDRAVADMRHGDMVLFDSLGARPVRETVRETSTQTGGLPCVTASSVLVGAGQAGQPRRGRDDLVLADDGGDFELAGADAFRTSCPGPSAQDILGPKGGALATATVPARELGARRLSITFRGGGGFAGSSYAGHRSGAVVLSLALVGSGGGTRRVRMASGEPVAP